MTSHKFICGLAHAPQQGQTVSGDGYLAEMTPRGMLACVFDGLGHGDKAHEASAKAVLLVRDNLHEEPDALIKLCHRGLAGTRGAVVSMASIDVGQRRVLWAGVGNVAAVILPSTGDARKNRRHLMVHGGIVGYRLPTVRVFSEPFAPDETLVFATDGIRSGFVEDVPLDMPPQGIADYVFKHFIRGTDDALVLTVRYCIEN